MRLWLISGIRLLRGTPRGHEVVVMADGQLTAWESVADLPLQAAALDQAQEAAGLLLQEAEAQALSIRQQAYLDGRTHGEREGAAAARAEFVAALQLVQAAAAQARDMHDRLLEDSEQELLLLATEIARAVVGEQAVLDPSLILGTVERALARAVGLNVVRIRVNPQDQALVSTHLLETASTRASSLDWEVAPDGSMSVGGCIVDVEGGEIDARLDVQLDQVARALEELRGDQDGVPYLGDEMLRAA